MTIKGTTKLLGIIGDPVEHSFSPLMHNAAIAQLQLDYVYLPLPVKTKDLQAALDGFTAIGLVGFNVTIPHKQTITPLLTEISPFAQMVGAVNTVYRSEKGWSGTNTDVAGFIFPLKGLDREWNQITPLVLGNGGAARAVVVGCAELGCREIRVVGRDRGKLEEFRGSWANTGLEAAIKVYSWDKLGELVSETELLINTTPVGMHPEVTRSPVTATVMEKIHPRAIVYDLIYTPNPTQFLQQAQQQGAVAIDGLEMLVQQGAAAFEIWLQQPAPVAVMRQTLQEYLGIVT